MPSTTPTRKDMAEFFRLALHAGLCGPAFVAAWAESIVIAEPSPHISFIELCIAGSQPASTVISLLGEVPGQATSELPAQMLLGHASRLLSSHRLSWEPILLSLYRNRATYLDHIETELAILEDDYFLARDGVYGTMAEIRQALTTFLKAYETYAPDEPPANSRGKPAP